jgi:RNA polymerase sigma-70 factor (ECF subfamily)
MGDPNATDSVSDTVHQAQRGDHAAFRALYEAHVGRIYALCLRLVGSASEAEEYTQDVFVRAWRRLDTFRGDSAFGTWLHRLAVNEVMQGRRAAARRSARVALPGDDDFLGQAATAAAEPDRDLEGAIARLPQGARQIFVLYDLEGYSHEEIAHLTGVAEGTSKAQLHRARRLLREALNR